MSVGIKVVRESKFEWNYYHSSLYKIKDTIIDGALVAPWCEWQQAGGAGKARFNVATPTYEARTRPLHVQHTYYRIIFKQNPFNIISRGVQRRTSTDFRLK